MRDSKKTKDPDATLDYLKQLLEEVEQSKQVAFNKISEEASKDDHRIYGMYVGQVLDIRKEMIKTTATDKQRMVIDALMGVADYFFSKEKPECARLLNEHQAGIVKIILDRWKVTPQIFISIGNSTECGNTSTSDAGPLKKTPKTKKKKNAAEKKR